MTLAESLPHLRPPNIWVTQSELLGGLPRPPGETPEDSAARDEAAIDALVALLPYDAFEARLCVRIITADAHAMDCLRQAAAATNDPAEARRCRNQASSMMRQSHAALRTLRADQDKRDKGFAERHPGALDAASRAATTPGVIDPGEKPPWRFVSSSPSLRRLARAANWPARSARAAPR